VANPLAQDLLDQIQDETNFTTDELSSNHAIGLAFRSLVYVSIDIKAMILQHQAFSRGQMAKKTSELDAALQRCSREKSTEAMQNLIGAFDKKGTTVDFHKKYTMALLGKIIYI